MARRRADHRLKNLELINNWRDFLIRNVTHLVILGNPIRIVLNCIVGRVALLDPKLLGREAD